MAIELPKNNVVTNRVATGTPQVGPSRNQQTATPQTMQPQVTQKADSVVITNQAQQLQNVQAKLSSLPDVDQKKVAEIKQAIAEGRYKVDPERLAANIIRFEKEMQDFN